jgi:hypothetical protein
MPDCGSCGAADASSVCSGCRFAAYCGPTCQRADWDTHKRLCRTIRADIAGCALSGSCDPAKTLCDGCAEPLNGVDERCKGCRFGSFCSKRCYMAHWRSSHKAVCRGLGEAKFGRTMALAAEGDAAAMYNIGLFYQNGTGVARDESNMVTWFARSSKLGYATAYLGLC